MAALPVFVLIVAVLSRHHRRRACVQAVERRRISCGE
jgi:hypothetical protein